MNQLEFYSYPHVVALGRRKMVIPPEMGVGKKPRDWEVYVRLMSGSSFTPIQGVTKSAAGRHLADLAHQMSEETGCTFVTTTDACVPFEHVARVYVDTQENEYVTIMEDSSGVNYQLERGNQSRCQKAVEIVAGTILQSLAQKGEA